MSELTGIKYISRENIDTAKWDACIDWGGNGLIYAYSFYLDAMAENWDALVLDDYNAVMPLTWKKKYGIHYLYQPFLCAQLGVFGELVTEAITGKFLQSVPGKFKFIEIFLNSGHISAIPSEYTILRNNYELDLAKPYAELYQLYNENTKRNIKKAQEEGYTCQKEFDEERVIDLALTQMRIQGHESSGNVNRFRNAYSVLVHKKMATTYGVFSAQNELMASCIFFFSHNRAYYILVGNHPDGRATGASHFLIDGFIKDHAGRKMILDFEGSDIPNLARFYDGFGAVQLVYPGIRLNRLPWYLKWLKK